jgi:hypothetical protein
MFVSTLKKLKGLCERLPFQMPARPAKIPASERLETEVTEMESIMAMLRGQFDDARAKVQPKGSRWAAAAEGPISKFDAHGELARKILAKKKPASSAAPTPPPSHPSPRSPAVLAPAATEIVVEPQAGKLWGQYTDSGLQPDEDAARGGSLWGASPNETDNARLFQEQLARIRGQLEDEVEQAPAGGGLWGPHPDELEEQMKFQREVARLRGEPPPIPIVESGEHGVGGTLVETKKKAPTAFTYFDFLVTRDILDGSSHLS